MKALVSLASVSLYIGLMFFNSVYAIPANESMHLLAQKSTKEKQKCDQFGNEAIQLLENEATEIIWSWDKRFEKLLHLIEAYPNTSKSTQEAYLLLRKTKNPDKNFNLEDLSLLESCRPIDYFNSVSKIISSFENIPKEKQQIAITSILKHIQAELEAPGPLVPLLVSGSIIEKLSDLPALHMTSSQKNKLSEIRKKANSIKQEMKEALAAASNQSHPRIYAKESELSKVLADSWLEVLKKTSR